MKDIDLNLEQLLRYFFSGVVTLSAWHIAYGNLPWLSQQDAAPALTLGFALALVIGTLIYALHRALIFPLIHRILLLFFWRPLSKSWRFWVTDSERAATIHFLFCSAWGLLAVILLGCPMHLSAADTSKYLLRGLLVVLLASAVWHNCRFVIALRDMRGGLKPPLNRRVKPIDINEL